MLRCAQHLGALRERCFAAPCAALRTRLSMTILTLVVKIHLFDGTLFLRYNYLKFEIVGQKQGLRE